MYIIKKVYNYLGGKDVQVFWTHPQLSSKYASEAEYQWGMGFAMSFWGFRLFRAQKDRTPEAPGLKPYIPRAVRAKKRQTVLEVCSVRGVQ